jgi:hypothetical protein
MRLADSVGSTDCIDRSPYPELNPPETNSEGHGVYGCGGGVVPDSGGLGLPRMADRMEYSELAASEPKAKLVSKLTLNIGSFGGKGSAVKTGCQSLKFEERENRCTGGKILTSRLYWRRLCRALRS